tara:strand:+ start:437 stop:1417 length:981 start_codon:yes stop_codon:yes gene_type:complete
MIGVKKNAKNEKNYVCEKCQFICIKKSDFDRHLLTRKHEILTNPNDFEKKNAVFYKCECGKEYKHKPSLYAHRKKCKFIEKEVRDISNIILENREKVNISEDNVELSDKNITKETLITLVNENNDIKNLLVEQQKQIVEQQKQISELIPKVGNTINNTANIKQKFNLNIFLNEKCKDAINMNEFIEKLNLTLENLDTTKTKGLTEGISNIFIENMNKLSVYERPLHCTDTKRDILYIKENDLWEKDKNNMKIKNVIKDINNNHFKLIKDWIEENPDFREDEEKQSYFAHLLKTCGTNIEEVNEKVIKKICTSTQIKDELKDLDEIK